MTDYSQYRAYDIEQRVKRMKLHIFDVMVTGATGVGKSTTLNALFPNPVASVGRGTDPETMETQSYLLGKHMRIWDTPGLGDGIKDALHKQKITKLLRETYTYDGTVYGLIDMAIVLIEGGGRDLGTAYDLMNNVIIPNISADRIFVFINQADFAMRGRNWDSVVRTPNRELLNALEEKALSVQRRIRESTGVNILKPVCYSAEYGWNVQKVYDCIIDHMPITRRLMQSPTVKPAPSQNYYPFSF